MSHSSTEECIESGEVFQGPNEEISEGGEFVEADVVCPICGREYTYIYEYQGVWDREIEKYVDPEEVGLDLLEDFILESGEFIGLNFVVRAESDERFEQSWVLDRLLDVDEGVVSDY
jgi:hypothetical protein